jgi:hypothetical protein
MFVMSRIFRFVRVSYRWRRHPLPDFFKKLYDSFHHFSRFLMCMNNAISNDAHTIKTKYIERTAYGLLAPMSSFGFSIASLIAPCFKPIQYRPHLGVARAVPLHYLSLGVFARP